eukprot:TRINITY_DN24529_c0_g2_i1.p1 TRINITY_DN24529_c0_g2~~TRINITY_DN24529_c0_g2_i1.p1  ORF type:complete len:516 (-),score=101.65 TRINITY_DN24529_c0_g2_i1:258-1805(-)
MAAAVGGVAVSAARAPRFVVLGGGLPGLATAYFLQRGLPNAHICIVERSSRCGGEIESVRSPAGRLREQGFHSSIFVNRQGREALGLLRLLGLEEDVISANIEASARRHLLHQGKVELVPGLKHMLMYGPAVLTEPLWPRGRSDDESVYDFVKRRSSRSVAERLADPICRGQLAGDARRLSVRTCFPRLWYNEKRFRSVFVGSGFSMMAAHRRRSWLSLDLLDPLLQRVAAGGRSYSLRHGLGMVPERLEEKLMAPPVGTRAAEFLKDSEVAALRSSTAGAAEKGTAPVEVVLKCGRTLPADAVVSSERPGQLGGLLEASGFGAEGLSDVQFAPVTVVNVAFGSDVLKGRFRGAGYFCGSLENEPILSVTSDAQLFPEQEQPSGRTRVSVYVDGEACKDASEAESAAVDTLRRHLRITEEPEEVHSTVSREAAPQYNVGHRAFLRSFDDLRRQKMPWLQVCGPGWFGTRAPADEIVDARELADSLCRRFARFPGLVENETEDDSAHRYGSGFDID